MANFKINQDIRQFYRQAETRDFTRDFLFRVNHAVLAGPRPGSNIVIDEADMLYCKTGQLPARSITNVAVPYMGLNFNIPGNATYPGSDGYNLTWYLDSKAKLRSLLEAASRNVFNDETSTGNYNTPTSEHYIEMVQLEKDLKPMMTYRLFGASIRNIDNISYQIAEGTGQTVELNTTISYHFYNAYPYEGATDLNTD